MHESENTSMPFCELQLRFDVEERCSTACLYYEATGRPPVGCLYKEADVSAFPRSIAKQLLKTAGRRSN